jgi:hypothetical protein
LTIEAVPAAATEERAPAILQTSVKTVRSYGCDQLMGILRSSPVTSFDEAVLVVSELGDPGESPIEVLANRGRARPHGLVTLDDLRCCMRAEPPPALER